MEKQELEQHLEDKLNEVLDQYPDDVDKQRVCANIAKDLTAALTDLQKSNYEKELEFKKLEESKKTRKTNMWVAIGTSIVGLLTVGAKMLFTAHERKATAAYEKLDIPITNATKEAFRDSNRASF